ncbi:MAG: outer membrane lipoprotein-sorting protein [Magnetococcales bacterium]|nr:outer membrane lipoprotein-sorting protein [Magnetococcales bacterium]
MAKTFPFRLEWVIVLLLLCSASAVAGEEQSLLERIDKGLFENANQVYFQITHRRPDATVESARFFSAWDDKDGALVMVLSPVGVAGRAVLAQGRQVTVRFPGEQGSHPGRFAEAIWGGVLSHYDLLRHGFARDHEIVSMEKSRGDEVVLTLKAKWPEMPYATLRLTVDTRRGVPVEEQQLQKDGSLSKTILYQLFETFDGESPRIARMEAINGLNPGYRSLLEVGAVRKESLPAGAFQPNALANVGKFLSP